MGKIHYKILSAFKNLDFEKLEAFLPNELNCFGVSKYIFLEKVKYIFDQMHLSGEPTVLIEADPFNENVFYVNYVPFVFKSKIEFVYEDNILSALRNDLDFDSEDFEYSAPLCFLFYDDEKVDFKQNEVYDRISNYCYSLVNRLENSRVPIGIDELINWHRTSKVFYNEIEYVINYKVCHDFKKLHESIEEIVLSYKHISDVKKALYEFDSSERNNELWFSKYGELFYEHLMVLPHVIRCNEKADIFYRLVVNDEIKIKECEVNYLMDFCNIFSD